MTFHIIHLKDEPIASQLKLEEILLACDDRNFCIINQGSIPAIVMGISAKTHEVVDIEKTKNAGVDVYRRFSGGGTVIVDEGTLFVTFICQKITHSFEPYPDNILKWSEDLYNRAFPSIFLRENDYVIDDKKCGGNAQYIKKERWLHHTSFLWDYRQERMNLLLHPKKIPLYREDRLHENFVCRLSKHFLSQEKWISDLKKSLASRYKIQDLPHTELLELQKLQIPSRIQKIELP